MIFTIILILSIFTSAIGVIWVWFFKNAGSTYEYYFILGKEKYELKDYVKAENLLLKSIELKDDFKDAKYYLGLTRIKTKEYQKAREVFEKLLKQTPKDTNIALQIAITYQLEENYEEAIKMHEKILKDNPDFFDSYFNLGAIDFRKNNFENALKFFERASEIKADDSETLFAILRCQDEMTDYCTEEITQKMINKYMGLFSKGTPPDGFYSVLAKVYAKSGQLEKTIEQCQKALAVNEEDIQAYELLGLAQLIKKDLSAVKDTLTTAINLQPKQKEIHNLMSYMFCQQDNRCQLKKCRQKYEELLEKFMKKNK